ncbi:MAG: hypothetical protein AAB339_05100 [Elusimicrobiota bacterium]
MTTFLSIAPKLATFRFTRPRLRRDLPACGLRPDRAVCRWPVQLSYPEAGKSSLKLLSWNNPENEQSVRSETKDRAVVRGAKPMQVLGTLKFLDLWRRRKDSDRRKDLDVGENGFLVPTGKRLKVSARPRREE